ncbi:MAG: carbohydrate ABC transporter substrate-binding protein, partial [Gemmatimonadales bacterium]|nr:carbohydrate ABC transporter substrate-binding protein [Gemmatimonadales bacterium]
SWEMFGDIILNPDYVLGGTDRALATTFSHGSIPLFTDPPEAFMHYMGSFNSGFITDPELGFPEGLVAGEDFDFFAFPTIDPDFAGGVTGDANIMILFNSDETT